MDISFNSKVYIFSFIVLLVFPALAVDNSSQLQNYSEIRNVILISWDGVQRRHLLELYNQGKLPNLQGLAEEGNLINITIAPFVKVEDGKPIIVKNISEMQIEDVIFHEVAVTDSGHARMLTGRWSHLTGIFKRSGNQLIDYVAGNNLEVVTDGLTIMELLKNKAGFKVGVASARHADLRKLIEQYGTVIGVFRGWGTDEIYVFMNASGFSAVGHHGFFSTTFNNSLPDLDFFFDSDWFVKNPPANPYLYGYFPAWDLETGKFVYLAELNAQTVAYAAMEWVATVKDENFFLFVHFCEPDLFGHLYGENSEAYSQAIIRDDEALGLIVDKLKSLGIYDETLILVTTDHGATENATGSTFYLDEQGRKWLISLGPLHGKVDQDNHIIWLVNNKFKSLPYQVTYQTDIVPLILRVLGVSTHDIAIFNVAVSESRVFEGETVTIYVDILNYGISSETFNLTVYANNISIAKVEVTVDKWNSTTIALSWNTSTFPENNYLISASADSIQNEQDTRDNTYVDGWVEVTKPISGGGGGLRFFALPK
mgnify:FL=1